MRAGPTRGNHTGRASGPSRPLELSHCLLLTSAPSGSEGRFNWNAVHRAEKGTLTQRTFPLPALPNRRQHCLLSPPSPPVALHLPPPFRLALLMPCLFQSRELLATSTHVPLESPCLLPPENATALCGLDSKSSTTPHVLDFALQTSTSNDVIVRPFDRLAFWTLGSTSGNPFFWRLDDHALFFEPQTVPEIFWGPC